MIVRLEEGRQQAIDVIARKKWVAHQVLFAHRHTAEPAIFHEELVEEFWAPHQYGQVLGFRGSAKSTYGEEDIALAALLRVYRNILIIGASETRAAERLAAIANELKT